MSNGSNHSYLNEEYTCNIGGNRYGKSHNPAKAGNET